MFQGPTAPKEMPAGYVPNNDEVKRLNEQAEYDAQWFPMTNAAAYATWELVPTPRITARIGRSYERVMRGFGCLPPLDHSVATNLASGARVEYYMDEHGTTSFEVREPFEQVPIVTFEDEHSGGCCSAPVSQDDEPL